MKVNNQVNEITAQNLIDKLNNHSQEPVQIKELTHLQIRRCSDSELESILELFNQHNLSSVVEKLVLSGNTLSELPTSIGSLSGLVKLDLSHNNFKSLPDAIGRLEELQVLELSNNFLKDLPKRFTQLKKLEDLKLDANYLNAFPDIIGELSSIKFLNIAKNDIRLLPESIVQLKELQALVLDGNIQLPDGAHLWPDALINLLPDQVKRNNRHKIEIQTNRNGKVILRPGVADYLSHHANRDSCKNSAFANDFYKIYSHLEFGLTAAISVLAFNQEMPFISLAVAWHLITSGYYFTAKETLDAKDKAKAYSHLINPLWLVASLYLPLDPILALVAYLACAITTNFVAAKLTGQDSYSSTLLYNLNSMAKTLTCILAFAGTPYFVFGAAASFVATACSHYYYLSDNPKNHWYSQLKNFSSAAVFIGVYNFLTMDPIIASASFLLLEPIVSMLTIATYAAVNYANVYRLGYEKI